MKNRKLVLMCATLFLLIVLRLQGEMSVKRVGTVFEYEKDPSAVGRIEAWTSGIKMTLANPWVGVGLGNYELFIKEYNPDAEYRVAHNVLLQIGGQSGIVALFIFLLLIVWSMTDCYQIQRTVKKHQLNIRLHYFAAIFQSSLWAYVICGIFLSLDYFEFFYVDIALIGGLRALVGKMIDRGESERVGLNKMYVLELGI